MSQKRRIGVVPTTAVPAKETVTYSWRVEWKLKDFPNDWMLFNRGFLFPSQALASYEEALKRPGCIAARIIERELRTTDIRREVFPEDLKGRI